MIQSNVNLETSRLQIGHETDPVQIERLREQMAQVARNSTWLQAHAQEVYSNHRGKFIAETVQQALALAQAAHPEDDGVLTQYIPIRRGIRIYANRRFLARL